MMEKSNSKGQMSIKDFFKSTRKYLKNAEEIKTNLPNTALSEKGAKRKFEHYSELDEKEQINNENYATLSDTKRRAISKEVSYSDIESINSDHISIRLPDNLLSNEDKIKNRFDANISRYNFVPFLNTLNSNISIHFTSNCSSNGSDYSKLFDEDFKTVQDIFDNNEYSKLIYKDNNIHKKLNKSKVIDEIDFENDVELQQPFAQSLLGNLRCNSTIEEANTSPCPCYTNSCTAYPKYDVNDSHKNTNGFVERYIDSICGKSDDNLLEMSPSKYSEPNDEAGLNENSHQLILKGICSNRLELEEYIISQQEFANSLLLQDFNSSEFTSNNCSFKTNKEPFLDSQDVTNIENAIENAFEVDGVANHTTSSENIPIDRIKTLNEQIGETLNSNLELKSISANYNDGLKDVLSGKCYEYIPDSILPTIFDEMQAKEVSREEKQNDHIVEYENILYNDDVMSVEEAGNKTEELGEDLKMITNLLYKVEEFYISNITTLEEFDVNEEKRYVETLNYKYFLKDQRNSNSTEENNNISKSCMKFLSSEHLLYIGDPETEISFKARDKLVIINMQRELNRLFADAAQSKGLYFKYKNTRAWDNVTIVNNMLVQKNDAEAKYTLVKKFVKHSTVKFNTMFEVMRRIFYLISRNERITKRELFYELNEINRKPSGLYDALKSVACVLKVPLWYCNIYSTSKGLAYGDLVITIDGKEVNFNRKGGTLVPTDTLNITRIVSKAIFILIVEKDTIFQKLLDEDIANKLTKPFLLVTGKGYADMSTRIFIKKIWTHCKIPAFILVDADPHGIEIMLTYKFGSLSLAHCSSHLALPQLRWLGVFPSEIRHLNINFKPLTVRDIEKVTSLLRRPYMKLNTMIKAELQELINNNVKAEIEGLIQRDKYLSETYIPDKLCSMNF